MSYTPTNWQTGDIITAEKLNKLEGGVANSITLPENAFVVNCTFNETSEMYDVDKTWAEILAGIGDSGTLYAVVDGWTIRMDAQYDDEYVITAFVHTFYVSMFEGKYVDNRFLILKSESSDAAEGKYVLSTDDIVSQLASLPPTDGTYVLKLTRSIQGYTFAWVAE